MCHHFDSYLARIPREGAVRRFRHDCPSYDEGQSFLRRLGVVWRNMLSVIVDSARILGIDTVIFADIEDPLVQYLQIQCKTQFLEPHSPTPLASRCSNSDQVGG